MCIFILVLLLSLFKLDQWDRFLLASVFIFDDLFFLASVAARGVRNRRCWPCILLHITYIHVFSIRWQWRPMSSQWSTAAAKQTQMQISSSSAVILMNQTKAGKRTTESAPQEEKQSKKKKKYTQRRARLCSVIRWRSWFNRKWSFHRELVAAFKHRTTIKFLSQQAKARLNFTTHLSIGNVLTPLMSTP